MSTSSSADRTAYLVSAIQAILSSEPAGLTSRDIAHRLVIMQAPYSSSSSGSFIKRVQRILSMYNANAKSNRGNCFRYIHDIGVWTLNKSHSQDAADFLSGILPTPQTKKIPSFQLSRNTSMTTTTVTPTPSQSSVSVISSAVGSSLTTGIMEQVSTWRTGGDTDDDDEASLEIYSNPSMNRSSFPSQISSGGSLLNGMEIMPTLHQLQFPQHPLDQHDDSLFQHNASLSDIMPPPSSTASYRRHSVSSHQQRPFSRVKRPSQDDNVGDQFVPSTTRASYHAMTADILARGVNRQTEGRFQGGMVSAIDIPGEHGSAHTPTPKSGFPSPQSTAPSPRSTPVQNFIQPSQSGSIRGDAETHHRQPSSHSGQLRLSPNQLEKLENSRQRPQSRKSMDEAGIEDEDEPMQREQPKQPHAPSPGFMKEDLRLRDLGASLQKSLSFNGDDEYEELQQDEEPLSNQARVLSVRHHPYLPRSRGDSAPQRIGHDRQAQRPQFESLFRDRKGKARALEEDREIIGKTPVLLNAINTSQTNILSELQTAQRGYQDELAHFREELYASLQMAFTRLADQVEGVGRAVVSVENAQRETAKQLGLSIGSAMGDGFSKMTDTLQQQVQQQIQQQIQQALLPYQMSVSRPASIRQGSPFSTSPSQTLGGPAAITGPASSTYTSFGGYGSGASTSRQNFGSGHGSREGAIWRRSSEQDLQGVRNDYDEDEDDLGRGKRRAVERPRSTSGSRRTIDRPRRDFEN
ncbi:hypothetical protein BX616_002618 [Lobosporangium transversale]|uniref:Uncharacterized protein n=1 Tax=Lobosporangium transversale TaxID=64571 RepID=A0A1Y2GKH1_9FUNG|nr:hypothetical protein BCR41DRAFT_356165 [Lobosporangium transversale]KAF9900355.1 hypothetical protein BX616_002618 [Lobosporangium transversale]ORZ12486.1 hypothetical protein BCR41DRAFT_356165 [Lobosporangium transversale]|eukprot:XP_021880105.1 hypothetical protein BCR41DRAFT_356165 [Lobosporangium transversale]